MNTNLTDLFIKTLNKTLEFKLGLDIYEYTINQKQDNWRDFEAELDVNYPIKGTEVTFSKEIFASWTDSYDNHIIVNPEKNMSSMDITGELTNEPFRHREMSFIYLFTILEDFGNSIIKITNNSYYKTDIENGKSWHSKVNKYAKDSGKDMKEGFAFPFGLDKSVIDEKFITLFLDLKQKRNSIVHELIYPESEYFNTDIDSLIVLICYLYHINDVTKSKIKHYPWYDYDND